MSEKEKDKPSKHYKFELKEFIALYDEIKESTSASEVMFNDIKDTFVDLRGTFSPEQIQLSEEKKLDTQLEHLGNEIKKIHDNQKIMQKILNTMEERTRLPTFIGRIKELFYENLFATIFTVILLMILGYLGLKYLLGG